MSLVVMVVRGENMQMKEPTVNQRGVEVKAGTRKPAMEQRHASTATTGSGTDPSLANQIIAQLLTRKKREDCPKRNRDCPKRTRDCPKRTRDCPKRTRDCPFVRRFQGG